MMEIKISFKELRKISTPELKQKSLEIARVLMEARFAASGGSETLKSHVIRNFRRSVARMRTIVSERKEG
jgi:ribosomal protein L29